MSKHQPDYEVIGRLRVLQDQIDVWIKHQLNPEVYGAPAYGLPEMTDDLGKATAIYCTRGVPLGRSR